MPKRAYLILFLLGVLVFAAGSWLQTNPGYMDAYYYYYGGLQLAGGEGFSEMLLWNYLDDPVGLPHPSHAYWMPLTSILTAAGLKLFSGVLAPFKAAQVMFVSVAAFIPPLTAALGFSLTGKRWGGWLAGVLALFTGFHQLYLTTTDSFGLYMLLGVVFFLLALKWQPGRHLKAAALGGLAGLFHLIRVDGVLWLGVTGLVILFELQQSKGDDDFRSRFRRMFTREYFLLGLLAVGGYVLVMSPWFIRNLGAFGSMMPPGSGRALWVRDYDELFSFPASVLTPAHLFAGGWWEILSARGEAAWVNLISTFASTGVLLPGLAAVPGLWKLRRDATIKAGLIGLMVLYLMMTLLFPFSGMRGSYFHGAAAFAPLVLAAGAAGLDEVIGFLLGRFKSWKDARIRPFLSGVMVLFAVGFSGYAYISGVIGLEGEPVMAWNEQETIYQAVDAALADLGAAPDAVIVCASPPAMLAVNGRPALGVPDGDAATLLSLMESYGASWALVEENHPAGLEALFENPGDAPGLTYLETAAGVHIFRRGE